jgi:hypothetical protein
MTSINPYSNPYGASPQPLPSTGSSTTITVTRPDGTQEQVEVVTVVGTRKSDSVEIGGQPRPPPFGPYGGRTGAEENFQRDMGFAMSSPEDRARMLGMNPHASADLERQEETAFYQIGFSTVEEIDDKWANTDDGILQNIQLRPVPPSSLFARPPVTPRPHLWQPGETPTPPLPGVARGLPPRTVEPPTSGPFVRGPASRPSEAQRGGQSLYDPKGGEWRWHFGDRFHRPHWDYNPKTSPNSEWQNIVPSFTAFVETA